MRLLLLCMALLLAASSGQAATIITSSTDAALAGATLIDFNSETDGLDFTTATVGALTVRTNTNTLRFDDQYSVQFGTSGVQVETRAAGSNDDLELVFATSVTAFGFDINALDIDLTMELYDSGGTLLDSFLIPSQPSLGMSGNARRDYWGGSSAAPVARVRLLNSTQHDFFVLDNVSFVPAPEPSTVVLLALGLAGLAAGGNRGRLGIVPRHKA
jgi:hypothetical protein